ncbi:uncharacterized protein [Procambarus clarkii]|uniref:uncharacterized protein isoform X2 n=1 Tax=Procambarus clarkii TaxID=6728 RepID=UPI003744AAD1
MHLPLLLSCDTLVKTKKPWPNLHWIGKDSRKAYLISQHVIGEVDLLTGNASKVQKIGSLIKTAAAVNYTYNGTYVYGILTSGDIFFWNQKTESLTQAQGIPALVTHMPSAANKDSDDGPLQVVMDFFKLLRTQNPDTYETTQNAQLSPGCSVPSHHKPKLFASSDCSIVIVVLGASQVYLWERDLSKPFNKRNSSFISGQWSVVASSSDIPLPTLQSRETQVTSCFLTEGRLEKQCHTTFSFVDDSCLIITTLILQWGGFGCVVSEGREASACWNYVSVSHLAIGMKGSEVLQSEGTLISQYAHSQSLICTGVNSSLQQRSKLVYLHPMCNTAVVTNVCDAAAQHDFHNSNGDKFHWVSSLAWCRDNTYVVGCLRSGAVFMATRMGPLVKISCSGESLQLQAAMILPLYPYSDTLRRESSHEEQCVNTENYSPASPAFSVSCHPVKDQFLLSSGVRISVLVLPENGRRDGDVVDQLLAAANHALYLLRHSSLTHDYAYIRCSTWRLARSVVDLSQDVNGSFEPDQPKISLWGKNSLVHKECKTRPDIPSEGEKLIEEAMKPLLAAWALIASHTGPQTHDWRKRPKHVARQLVKLVNTLMQTTLNDDYSQHQAQLLQMLHVFHHFVRVLAVWPRSLHMVRPTIWLTHQIIHIFLSCERHAGESSMINTILILTQTLSSVESTLTQVYTFRPLLKFGSHLKYSNVEDAPGTEGTNIDAVSWKVDTSSCLRSNSAVCMRMKKLWLCLHINSMKVYNRLREKKMETMCYQKSIAALNIIQSRLQKLGHDFSQKKIKIKEYNRLFLNGIYLGAVENWKSEIIKYISYKRNRKTLCKYFHSIFYTYLLQRDFTGISNFLSWLCSLLSSHLFVIKQCKLSDNIMSSTPKPKKSVTQTLPQELQVSLIDRGTIMINSQGTTDEVTGPSAGQKPKRYSQQNCESSNSTMKNKITNKKANRPNLGLICATRQVIGSLGRIMANVILQREVHIPSPHTPHIESFNWLDSPNSKESTGVSATFSPLMMKDAIQKAHWSSETAAQALAIAGYWSDLSAFSQELGDAKTALLSSLISVVTEKNRIPASSSLHPSALIVNYVLHCGPMEELKSSVFHSYQELLQLAAMTCLDVIPTMLEECLQKIEKVMQHLEVFVPSYVYLPAPPVFCPQVSSHMRETLELSDDDVRCDERTLRMKIAGWVRVFCSVVSAAGIAQPLLQDVCYNYQPYSKEVSDTYRKELDILVEALGNVEADKSPQGSEWSGITRLWQKLLGQLWILHVRDKLSLCVRKSTVNSSSIYKKKSSQGSYTAEILTWVQVLYKLIDSSSWRDELIATALTAASNSPSLPTVALALAHIIPSPSQLPSLLKERANRLYDLWKTTNVASPEVNNSPEEKKSGRRESLIDTYTQLYHIYEKECLKEIERDASRKCKEAALGNTTTFDQSANVIDMSSTPQTTAESVSEEFRKFVFLFASMTFARDAEMFPQQLTQIPHLTQFSDVIKKREFQGMKIKTQIFQSKHEDCTEHLQQNIFDNINCSDVLNTSDGKSSMGKKGFFRNLDYTKIWQGDSLTVAHLHNHTFDTNGLRRNRPHHNSFIFQKNNLISQNNPCHHTTKGVDSYFKQECSMPNKRLSKWNTERRRSKSYSSMRKQVTPTVYNRRCRSVSVTKYQKKNMFLKLNSTDVASSQGTCSNQNSPLNNLLCLPNCQTFGVKSDHLQELIKLVSWMMSSERKFCFPTITVNTVKNCTKKKVDLGLEDIILALGWECLYSSSLHNTLESTPMTHGNKKEQAAKTMDTEVPAERNKEQKTNQCKQTAFQARSSSEVVDGAKEIDVVFECVASSNGAQEEEHSVREVVNRSSEIDTLPTTSSMGVQEIENYTNGSLGVLTTTGRKDFEYMQKEEIQSSCNLNPTIDTAANDQEDKSSCILNQIKHGINGFSAVDVDDDAIIKENVTSNSSSAHIKSCANKMVAVDATVDEQDKKALNSMNLHKIEYNLAQPSSSSIKTHSPAVEKSQNIKFEGKTNVNDIVTEDCSHSPQNAASSGNVSIEKGVIEEEYQDIAIIKTASKVLWQNKPEVCQASHSVEELGETIITTDITSSQSKKEYENLRKETNVDKKGKTKARNKVKEVYEQTKQKNGAQNSGCNNSSRLFTAKHKSLHKLPNVIIEVKEAGKLSLQHKILPSNSEKKIRLTPIETASEIFENKNSTSPKWLYKPFATSQERKRLSISDLSCDATSTSNCSIGPPVDDTLDDITLPDSLHASDLEDECDFSIASQNRIQENIIKRNKFEFSKRPITGKDEDKFGATHTLKEIVKPKKAEWWNKNGMILKPIPTRLKPISTNLAYNLGEQQYCGQGKPQTFMEKDGKINRKVKLLVLPKHSMDDVASSTKHPPLLLKRLPAGKILQVNSKNSNAILTLPGKGCSDYPVNIKTHNHQRNGTKQLPQQQITSKNMKLLTLPVSSYSQPREKTGPNFKFVDPKQVFSYYMANVIKDKHQKFKTLKLNKPHISQNLVEIEEKEVCRKLPSGSEGEGFEKSNAQDESVDKDFIKKAKEYADKYETSTFTNILPSFNKRDGTLDSRDRYEPIQRVDTVSQSHCQLFTCNKETQTVSQVLSGFQHVKVKDNKEIISCDSEGVDIQGNIELGRRENGTDEKVGLSSSPVSRGLPREKLQKVELSSSPVSWGLPQEKLQKVELSSSPVSWGLPQEKLQKVELSSSPVSWGLPQEKLQKVELSSSPVSWGLPQEKLQKVELSSSPVSQGSPHEKLQNKLIEERIIKVKDSWTEMSTIDLDQTTPLKSCEVQTQTQVETTKDASVSTDNTPCFYEQPPQDDLSCHPLPQQWVPQAHLLPSHDISSSHYTPFPTTSVTHAVVTTTTDLNYFTKLSHEIGTPGEVVRIADIPQEVAQRQLEEIGDELYKTIHNDKPDVLPSASDVTEQIVVLSNSVENGINKDVKDDIATKRLETLHTFLINESSAKDKYDDVFKHNDTQDRENIISEEMKAEDVVFTDSQAAQGSSEYPKIELPLTCSKSSPEDLFKGNNTITMNELFEAFSDGRITLEDVYKMSYHISVEDGKTGKEEQILDCKGNSQDIEELEQQAIETALGLDESRNLLSKVNHLLQISENLEKERLKTRRYQALDENIQQSSSKNKKNLAHDITSNAFVKPLRWQEMLSSYKKSGNPDMLLNFFETVNLEEVTDEMIDEMIMCEEMCTTKHSQDTSSPFSKSYLKTKSLENNGSSKFKGHSKTDCEGFLNKKDIEMNGMTDIQEVVDGRIAGRISRADWVEREDKMNEQETGMDSPKFHLDLTNLGSWSSNPPTCAPEQCSTSHDASPEQCSTSHDASPEPCSTRHDASPSHTDTNRQQRRAEVRAWMKKQRERRSAEAQAMSRNTISNTQLNTYKNSTSSKKQAKMVMNNLPAIKMENQGLCGKQLRERSREREDQRAHLREHHQRKREEDVAKLLVDHEEELVTHRDLLIKKLPNDSPRISSASNSTNESHHNLRLHGTSADIRTAIHSQKKCVDRLKSSCKLKSHNRSRRDSLPAGKSLPRCLDRRRKEEQISLTTNDGSSLTISPVSRKVPADKNNVNLLHKLNIANISSVQTELDNLIKCLGPVEKKKSLSFHRESSKSSSCSLQMKSERTKRNENSENKQKTVNVPEQSLDRKHTFKSNSDIFHQINTTFPLSLDRISEVDSDTSAASSLAGPGSRREESLPAGFDGDYGKHETSSESSWTVPSDVKKLLYG